MCLDYYAPLFEALNASFSLIMSTQHHNVDFLHEVTKNMYILEIVLSHVALKRNQNINSVKKKKLR